MDTSCRVRLSGDAAGDVSDRPAVLDFDAGRLVLATPGRRNASLVRGDQEIADRHLNLFSRI